MMQCYDYISLLLKSGQPCFLCSLISHIKPCLYFIKIYVYFPRRDWKAISLPPHTIHRAVCAASCGWLTLDIIQLNLDAPDSRRCRHGFLMPACDTEVLSWLFLVSDNHKKWHAEDVEHDEPITWYRIHYSKQWDHFCFKASRIQKSTFLNLWECL